MPGGSGSQALADGLAPAETSGRAESQRRRLVPGYSGRTGSKATKTKRAAVPGGTAARNLAVGSRQTKRTRAVVVWRCLRIAKPMPAKPRIISIHAAGSGTGLLGVVTWPDAEPPSMPGALID